MKGSRLITGKLPPEIIEIDILTACLLHYLSKLYAPVIKKSTLSLRKQFRRHCDIVQSGTDHIWNLFRFSFFQTGIITLRQDDPIHIRCKDQSHLHMLSAKISLFLKQRLW